MSSIKLLDKTFVPYFNHATIKARISELARQLDQDYKGKQPLYLVILNGSFLFAAELYQQTNELSQITFIKLASYEGTSTTGDVITTIGLDENLKDRHVIIVEDIVDTGNTIVSLLKQLSQYKTASISVATLFLKPTALQHAIDIRYIGFEIEDKFVVGYGMDYNGYGRNLLGLYQIKG